MSESTTLAPPVAAPSTPPVADDVLYEVIDGRVVEKPPMGALETCTMIWLNRLLTASEAISRLGVVAPETLFLLDRAGKLKRRPDMAFVSFERWPIQRPVTMEEAWEVVPELAIEVISKTNLFTEVVDEVNDYFRAGVRLVWLILPVQKLVYAYRSPTDVRILQPGDDLDGGDVVPGFRLPVRDLFTAYGDGGAAPA
jgi:Uma2 family endonuclease